MRPVRLSGAPAFSKLLLVYDNANTNIGFDDFFVTSSTAPFFTGPSYGPLLAAGSVQGPEEQTTISAFTEPRCFAVRELGLLALGFAAFRRRV